MKSIYITSVERYSGKTATCLAIGQHLNKNGYKVGYLKPLSFQPWRIGDRIADEDAAFVKEILNLSAEPWDISPLVVTEQFLRDRLKDKDTSSLIDKVIGICEDASREVDITLFEGGGSLREGYVVGLPTPNVAKALGSDALAIVKYRDRVRVLDDALAAYTRLEDTLKGIIINRVPKDAMGFVLEDAVPYLEMHDIPVFGVLPETHVLESLTVAELISVLDAKILTENHDPENLIETLTVGAMTAEAALSRFRKQSNKAVITGGDRSDIQLAALETSTTCLVLTGNLQPSPLIIKQADDMEVAVLLVPGTTMETVEIIESVFGKTRLGQKSKLEKFEKLLFENIDLQKFYKAFDLKI